MVHTKKVNYLDAWLKFTLEVRPDASRPTYQLYILHSRAFVLSIGAEWELMPDPITPRAGLIYATRCNPSSTFASHFLLPLFLPRNDAAAAGEGQRQNRALKEFTVGSDRLICIVVHKGKIDTCWLWRGVEGSIAK